MTPENHVCTVRRFNDCINSRDIDALATLMTDDHRFIDSAGNILTGKAGALEAWEGFFAAFPDYRNVFDRVQFANNMVVMAGHSTCSDKRLDGPALWSARIRDGKVAEWRVYEDTLENRAHLSID